MNKTLIPKLRFPEFSWDWEFKNAWDIFESVSDRNHNWELDLLAATQDKWIVRRKDLDLKINSSEQWILNYKIVNPWNFVISLRSFQWWIEYSNIKWLVSPAYTILKSSVPISDYFYKIFLKKESFISSLDSAVIWIRDWKQISYSVFSKLKLRFNCKKCVAEMS